MNSKPKILNPCVECMKYNDMIDDMVECANSGLSPLDYLKSLLKEMLDYSKEADGTVRKIVYPDVCNNCHNNNEKRLSIYSPEEIERALTVATECKMVANTITNRIMTYLSEESDSQPRTLQ